MCVFRYIDAWTYTCILMYSCGWYYIWCKSFITFTVGIIFGVVTHVLKNFRKNAQNYRTIIYSLYTQNIEFRSDLVICLGALYDMMPLILQPVRGRDLIL